jgi:hypothetical protein
MLNARRRAEYFLEFAQVIRVPDSLAKLQKVKNSKTQRTKMEKICDTNLGPTQAAQCMSAIFETKKGKRLLCYFGRRTTRVGDKPPVIVHFTLALNAGLI